MIKGLEGKVAVVTGGASGIGEATCRAFRRAGADVVVLDRDGERARAVAEELGGEPAAVDVAKRAELDAAAERVRERFGRADVLANVAGVFVPNKPAEETPPEDCWKTYEVNYLGTLQASQAFFPLLREADGAAIVNVASQAALVSLPWQTAYSASKGAVATLTRCLAIDWAEHGIRVNCTCPGFTLTPMSAPVMTETLERAVGERVPLGRVFSADEQAAAILFLGSPLASAITGVVIPVDGGWTAGQPSLPW